MLNDGDADQDEKQRHRHDRCPPNGRRAERLGVDAVCHQVGAPRGPAVGQSVDGVENLCRTDDPGDEHEERRRPQHWQGDAPEPLPGIGAVGACGRVDIVWDRQQTRQEKQRHVADVGPDDDRRNDRQRKGGIGKPFDAMPQHGADGTIRGSQEPAPQHRDRQGRADPRQHVQRAEDAGARKLAGQHRGSQQSKHRLRGNHERHEDGRDNQRVAKAGVGQDRPPVRQADIAQGPEQVPPVQAQPDHDENGQQQEREHPEQAGRQQAVGQRRGSTGCVGHGCIKAGRYGVVVTPNRGIDADFLDLPRHRLAEAALSAATAAGASHADLRVHRISTEIIQLRDGELETAVISREVGLGVRVIVDGTWGFASHAELAPSVAADTARRAVHVAKTLAALNGERVELAAEPVYADASWMSNYRVDPFDIPAADKIAVLRDYSGRLLGSDGIDHVSAGLTAAKEQVFYADTFGSSITQQRVRVMPSLEAVTVDSAAGSFDSMRTLAPPMARGWEALADDQVWNWTDELAQLPSLLAEKVKAPSVTPGRKDLVIDPTNLWLTIHESIGHATEYDRAIGYEAAYAGTSFATPDKLGTMRYGSPVMNVTADRMVEFGLASIGYDDEGVAAQSWDLVRDGIFVGYQLDRVFAPRLGLSRSNGCSYADSPHHVPIQRMANVSLQPSPEDRSTDDLIARVDDGIYIVGDRSWSIDMQRYNFQFTGQRFYRIRNGRLDGQVRDVAYQATTTDFWNSMEAVGGPSTWRLGGAYNCGKAQPGQLAAVSHGCPSALFRGVNVLNARIEAGQ